MLAKAERGELALTLPIAPDAHCCIMVMRLRLSRQTLLLANAITRRSAPTPQKSGPSGFFTGNCVITPIHRRHSTHHAFAYSIDDKLTVPRRRHYYQMKSPKRQSGHEHRCIACTTSARDFWAGARSSGTLATRSQSPRLSAGAYKVSRAGDRLRRYNCDTRICTRRSYSRGAQAPKLRSSCNSRHGAEARRPASPLPSY